MVKMDFSTYMQIAQYSYEYVQNAIKSYYDDDLEKSKNFMFNALFYLYENKFFAFKTPSDFHYTENDYYVHKPQIINEYALYNLGDFDNVTKYNKLHSEITNMYVDNNYKNAFTYDTINSIIYKIFGFCLGAKLNKMFGVN